jgi:hypothetical protein
MTSPCGIRSKEGAQSLPDHDALAFGTPDCIVKIPFTHSRAAENEVCLGEAWPGMVGTSEKGAFSLNRKRGALNDFTTWFQTKGMDAPKAHSRPFGPDSP